MALPSPARWARDTRQAIGVAARQPALARAELAFGATVATDLALTVGLGVVAFRDGGAAAVGLVAAVRLVPSAIVAPVATTLADRRRREHALAVSSAVTGAAAAGMAVVVGTDGPLPAVYALAVLATIGLTPYRAAHSALLPSLCRSSLELTASNVVRTLLESVSVVLGPLGAALLLHSADVGAVFGAAAVTAGIAFLLVLHLPYEHPPVVRDAGRGGLRHELADGARMSWRNRDARLLIGLAATQTFLRGGLGVFTVVLAIDTLGRDDASVGVLQSALGFGAIVGAVGTSALLGTRRMAAWFGAAVAMWGIPLCIIGMDPTWVLAFGMLAVIGLANAVLDVGLFTMLGRIVPDEVLARVFGIFEAVVAATVALGALVAAAAVEGFGVRWALVLLGSIAPAAVAFAWHHLRKLDASLTVRQDELDVLQGVPMLRALSVPVIERLARRSHVHVIAPGAQVARQGTAADSYYVVARGEVEVRKDGMPLRRLGPGDGFGEIALLLDVPRTASVVALGREPVELLRIDREDFISAISGFTAAREAAESAIAKTGETFTRE